MTFVGLLADRAWANRTRATQVSPWYAFCAFRSTKIEFVTGFDIPCLYSWQRKRHIKEILVAFIYSTPHIPPSTGEVHTDQLKSSIQYGQPKEARGTKYRGRRHTKFTVLAPGFELIFTVVPYIWLTTPPQAYVSPWYAVCAVRSTNRELWAFTTFSLLSFFSLSVTTHTRVYLRDREKQQRETAEREKAFYNLQRTRA